MSKSSIENRINLMKIGKTPGKVGYGEVGRSISLISMKRAIPINTKAAPLEYMVDQGWLETRDDKSSVGRIRFSVALRCREFWEGANISTIKVNSYEPTISGGGVGNTLSDYQMDCLMTVSHIKKSMPAELFTILEQVVMFDVWLWKKRHKTKRPVIIKKIHMALDHAAIAIGYMELEEFKQRWKSSPGQQSGR